MILADETTLAPPNPSAYGFPPTATLMYLGPLERKTVGILLRAMPLIIQRVDAHLFIAGSGRDEEALRNITEELHIDQYVTFTDEALPIPCISGCCIIRSRDDRRFYGQIPTLRLADQDPSTLAAQAIRLLAHAA